MKWRKLLATFFALSGIFFAVSVYFLSTTLPNSPVNFFQLALVVLGIVCAGNSVFIWRGNRWSLWLLRIGIVASIVLLAGLATINFFEERFSLQRSIGNIALTLSVLSIPAFFLAILWHPQVVSEFHASVEEP